MKKTLTDSEMLELRQLGYLGGAHLEDLIEFLDYKSKMFIEHRQNWYVSIDWGQNASSGYFDKDLCNALYECALAVLRR